MKKENNLERMHYNNLTFFFPFQAIWGKKYFLKENFKKVIYLKEYLDILRFLFRFRIYLFFKDKGNTH